MQVINLEDFQLERLRYRMFKGKKSMREIIRERYRKEREFEANLRNKPWLARLCGREDLITENDNHGLSS